MATIVKRNGKFSARIRIKGYPTVSQSFNTARAAQSWAVSIEDAIRRGTHNFKEAIVPNLSEALRRYEGTVTVQKRGALAEKYVISIWRQTKLARQPLDFIQPSEVAELRDAWLKNLAPGTVTRRLTLLSHLFEIARKDWGLPVQNPVKDVRRPSVHNERARRITDEELRLVLAASRSSTLKTIAPLALATGARLGELVGAQWRHVDLQARVMHFPLTKNGTSRTIPLSPDALAILSPLSGQVGESVFKVTSHSMSTAWIRAVDRARQTYEKECVRAGVEISETWLVGLRFHDLRHEFTSRMAERGLNAYELSAITGHKNLGMLARYTHLRPSDLAAKLASLEARA
ncbi:site-specific integrase [Pusillimonas sp. ANT_WB101]|nr:site-specific integrase [Pusillimonas sp. ANT_WB101]